jgi:hypothetical protein
MSATKKATKKKKAQLPPALPRPTFWKPCPFCGKSSEEQFIFECPECARNGCPECMPAGRGCVCPECEEP